LALGIACALLALLYVGSRLSRPSGDAPADPGCPPPPADQSAIPFDGEPMVALCRDVHVERAASAEERELLKRGYAEGMRKVEDALGPLQGEHPVMIFCKTHPCQVYFTGPTRRSWALGPGKKRSGATYTAGDRHTIIVNHVDSKAKNVMAHEVVHIESRFRKRGAPTPAWFNEGVATYIGGEPDCSQDQPRGIDSLLLLESHDEWNRYTDQPDKLLPTYCQARREIETWVRRSGPRSISVLLDAVRDGTSFADAYGPMTLQ
jgi:hypothetical protein